MNKNKSFHFFIIHKSMNQTWQYTIANIRCDKYQVGLLHMDNKLLAVWKFSHHSGLSGGQGYLSLKHNLVSPLK